MVKELHATVRQYFFCEELHQRDARELIYACVCFHNVVWLGATKLRSIGSNKDSEAVWLDATKLKRRSFANKYAAMSDGSVGHLPTSIQQCQTSVHLECAACP